MARFGLAAAAVALILSLSAQAAGTGRDVANCLHHQPQIQVDSEGHASIDIEIMLYNVEGLPFPARLNRSKDLGQIGVELAAMRATCKTPRIIVLQEVFSEDAERIAAQAGYVAVADGPERDARRSLAGAPIPDTFLAGQRFSRGEGGPKLVDGGLQILSDYPVLEAVSEPFSDDACAGTDCLSNKGAMLVRVRIPGLPVPLEILNTHMNSRKGAGVSYGRTDVAHHLQSDELADFLQRHRSPGYPLLIAGDFNMKDAAARFSHFERRMPQPLVHRHCANGACVLNKTFETAQPWMETQDLHAFESGGIVTVRPLRLDTIFDGLNGPMLSDHIATIVTYRLSWPVEPST